MSRVSVLLQAAARPGSGPTDYTAFLAIRLLGTRLYGTPKYNRWRYSHIFVAIDKFMKWIKVKPVTATTAAKAAEFIAEMSH